MEEGTHSNHYLCGRRLCSDVLTIIFFRLFFLFFTFTRLDMESVNGLTSSMSRNGNISATMDAELSLIMANQALCAPGKLVYDPFVGTGSFLMTCAHFGAMTVGSDIDGRQIRGKGKASIQSNSEQYNLKGRVLDALVFDVCHSPWRTFKEGLFDAIVTDRKSCFYCFSTME
jgi:hypothetical protein